MLLSHDFFFNANVGNKVIQYFFYNKRFLLSEFRTYNLFDELLHKFSCRYINFDKIGLYPTQDMNKIIKKMF